MKGHVDQQEEELKASSAQNTLANGSMLSKKNSAGDGGQQPPVNNALFNVFVIVGFGLFAYLVKAVLISLTD